MSMFLNKALKSQDFEESLRDNQKTSELKDFIGHVLTDLNYYFENSFHNFEEIRQKIEELRSNPAPAQDLPEGEDDPKARIEKMKEQCKTYLDLGRVNLSLLLHLVRLVPNEFDSSECARQTALIINLYADKMSSKKYKQYRFQGIQELGLKPLRFIATLIEIYTSVGDLNFLMNEVVSDERSYSRKTLIDIGSTAFEKKLVSDKILKKFENIILKLEKLEEEHRNLNEIIGDEYPDEFTCGLTYELMKDPVKLKTSDVIVDRKHIEKQITINGEVDPFNRTTLKKSDLVPQPELKAQIEEWMEAKMRIYRQKFKKDAPKEGTLFEKQGDVYGQDGDQDTGDNAFYNKIL